MTETGHQVGLYLQQDVPSLRQSLPLSIVLPRHECLVCIIDEKGYDYVGPSTVIDAEAYFSPANGFVDIHKDISSLPPQLSPQDLKGIQAFVATQLNRSPPAAD